MGQEEVGVWDKTRVECGTRGGWGVGQEEVRVFLILLKGRAAEEYRTILFELIGSILLFHLNCHFLRTQQPSYNPVAVYGPTTAINNSTPMIAIRRKKYNQNGIQTTRQHSIFRETETKVRLPNTHSHKMPHKMNTSGLLEPGFRNFNDNKHR